MRLTASATGLRSSLPVARALADATIIACHEGFATTNGAVGVGNATRRTVIISFLAILISGYMLTRMFYV